MGAIVRWNGIFTDGRDACIGGLWMSSMEAMQAMEVYCEG